MQEFKTIRELIHFALTDKSNENAFCVLRKVTKKEAETIKNATGLSVDEYYHTIERYDIQHILKHHGNDGKERLRGQIAVKPEDFVKALEIISDENLVYQGYTKAGKPAFLYEKRIGNKFFYIEEVRTGRKKLNLTTLYKRR